MKSLMILGVLHWVFQIYLTILNSMTSNFSLAFAMKNNDLFNLLWPLDEIHNGIIPIFKEYAKLRQSISRELPANISGTVAVSKLDEDTENKYGPIFAGNEYFAGQWA